MAILSFDVFWRDHGAKEGAEDLGKATKKAGDHASGMSDAFKVGAVAVGAALFEMGKASIDVANDVSESQSKVRVVFGKSADSVTKFAETSASSFGISKASALDAAGTFGNLFVSLKLPQAEAAKMSTKMLALAADMASFNNASPEEALEAMRSGLLGETEPLRRFGVNMDDASLRVQALKMGLIDSTKNSLTPATKAQAAYGLMLAQTGTAQGDFARTSGGLANQQRILKARFSDMQAQLGEKLLPIMVNVTGRALDFASALDKNRGILIPLVAVVGGLAATVYTVNKAVKVIEATQAGWAVIMGTSTVATEAQTAALVKLRTTMATVGPVAAVLAAGIGAVWTAQQIANWQTGTVNVDALARSMTKAGSVAGSSAEEIKLFSDRGIFGLGKETINSTEALERFGTSAYNALDKGWDARLGRWQRMGTAQSKFQKQTSALDESFAKMVAGGSMAQAAQKMSEYERAASAAGVPVASLRKMFPKYADAIRESKRSTDSQTTSTDNSTASLKANSEALAKNARALLKQRGSQAAYEQSVDDSRKALKDNGKTLDIHTAKGRNNRAALDDMAQATLDWRDAIKEAGGSQKKQDAALDKGRGQLIATGRRFGLTTRQAKHYADEVLGIPKKYSSEITLALNRAGIPQTLFGVKIGTKGNGLGFRLATGGRVFGAGTETSDSIPAYLSNNEHVWTAREVKAAGGHGAVEGMRRSVLNGYANGGGVTVSEAMYKIAYSTTGRLAKAIEHGARLASGFNPSLAGAVNFARNQVGKPYLWGAAGPGGYDCSGFISALTNVVQGRFPPYFRRFATGSFPSADFAGGPGAFSVGWFRGNPGHMAATINGVNVESAGGVGVRVGKSARGAHDSLFTGLAHLKGYARGGRVGDAPYDLLDPHGDRYAGDAVRRSVLFDAGGLAGGAGWMAKRTIQPERILSPRQTRSFDQLVRVLDRSQGAPGGEVHYHFPNYLGDKRDLVRALSDLDRQGRLDVIKR